MNPFPLLLLFAAAAWFTIAAALPVNPHDSVDDSLSSMVNGSENYFNVTNLTGSLNPANPPASRRKVRRLRLRVPEQSVGPRQRRVVEPSKGGRGIRCCEGGLFGEGGPPKSRLMARAKPK
ncbi:uncharacterized protein BKA78DRAFT_298016 [Phyllosticta capitalensis]|uniref:uncharacterized protein n=1 Tax=Phyllosticta capitalensis TaxID=121624 RepID=UPI00313194DB